MSVARYQERIAPVEAIQYKRDNLEIVKAFLGPDNGGRSWSHDVGSNRIRVYGAKGTGKADFDDWVVKDGAGVFFVVKGSEFERLYAPLEAPKAAAATK